MKSQIKSLLIDKPGQLSRLIAIATALRSKQGKRSDSAVNYAEKDGGGLLDQSPMVDLPTCFYIRMILEHQHKTAIEIGAMTAARISSVKRCIPEIDAFGIDISLNYREEKKYGDVTLAPYSVDFFKADLDSAIVLSHSTLNYIPFDDLKALFTSLRDNGIALALFEPVPAFENQKTLERSDIAYYHPYHTLLQELGFELAEPDYQSAIFHTFSLSMLEYNYVNYAKPV